MIQCNFNSLGKLLYHYGLSTLFKKIRDKGAICQIHTHSQFLWFYRLSNSHKIIPSSPHNTCNYCCFSTVEFWCFFISISVLLLLPLLLLTGSYHFSTCYLHQFNTFHELIFNPQDNPPKQINYYPHLHN